MTQFLLSVHRGISRQRCMWVVKKWVKQHETAIKEFHKKMIRRNTKKVMENLLTWPFWVCRGRYGLFLAVVVIQLLHSRGQ